MDTFNNLITHPVDSRTGPVISHDYITEYILRGYEKSIKESKTLLIQSYFNNIDIFNTDHVRKMFSSDESIIRKIDILVSSKSEITRGIADARTSLDTGIPPMRSGYYKYLKYKNKYLQLKNKLKK